jgi:hypothetical protein
MSNLPKLPNLGSFFGDSGGGPNLALPQSEAFPNCPFLDKQQEFCSLDGNMCPFVGFNYRRCKKYLNNMAKGMSNQMATGNPVPLGSNQPPRVDGARSPQRHPRIESLFEVAKKRGSKKDPSREAKKKIHKQRTARQKQLDAKAEVEAKEDLETDPALLSMVQKYHQMVTSASTTKSDASAQNMAHLIQSAGIAKPLLDYATRMGAKNTEDEADRMASLYAAFMRHKLNAVIPEGRIGAMKDFARNIFLYAAVAHGDQEYTPTNAGAARQAKEDAVTHKDKGSVGMQGEEGQASGRPKEPTKSKPTPRTSKAKKDTTEKAKRGRFTHIGRIAPQPRGSAPEPNIPLSTPPITPPEEKAAKAPRTGTSFGMTTPSKMNSEQFANWVKTNIETLPKSAQRYVLAGVDRGSLDRTIQGIKDAASDDASTRNLNEIAKNAAYLAGRVKKHRDMKSAEMDMKQAWDTNLRKIKSLPIGDRKAYEMAIKKAHDPKQLNLMAKIMNKTLSAAYTLEAKTIKIGGSELTTFVRKATLPTFDRSDYEVMRMAEQAGLKAIQKQHQYGLGYGKWSTWVTFFKDLLVPFVLWWTGHSGYIRPLMHLPIQKFADQLYTSYIQSPLPKFKGRSGLQISRDDKFEMSQKMGSGSKERLMRGWEKDDILPPDQAVLHQRWYPTTKKTWGKTRTKELSKRYQASKAAPTRADDWTRGYL